MLYASTTLYMAALVWNHASMTGILSQATSGLFSETFNGIESLDALEVTVLKQSWMATVALGINVSPIRYFGYSVGGKMNVMPPLHRSYSETP